MKKFRASLSLEATIAFTVFISFMMMLLLVVKMAMTVMALDQVTAETAKKIATSAYPLGLFNASIDDSDESVELKKFSVDIFKGEYKATTNNLVANFTQKWTGDSNADIESAHFFDLLKPVFKANVSVLVNEIYKEAQDIVSEKGVNMVKSDIVSGLEDIGVGINFDNLKITVCKLPVPKKVYNNNYTGQEYTDMGLDKTEFGADDVVIGLTYDYELTLPFLKTFKIKLKSVAIEHAWINGGKTESVSDEEGIDFDNFLYGKHFYIPTGGHGNCYHKGNCMVLWRYGRKQAISVSEIKGGSKYRPCNVCKPKIGD